ncbi:hypothetical protein [Herbidospora daliensis]|uniref:hypothetical protein n=1 Tax=Herbidospora daliensis TaxID=295585 RepID=UPI000AD8D628|nr:hypothetical protein [Herbidospora daliensis]
MRSALLRALMAVVIALAAVLVPAGPASAGIWQLSDSFEPVSNPASRWAFTDQGDCEAPYFQSDGIASPRTGTGMAGLRVHNTGGWCSLSRTIFLSPVPLHPGARCSAGVWLDLRNAAATFNLEVINPANWTYIALKTVPVDQTVASAWRLHTVSWTAQRSDVVLRLTVGKAFNHTFASRAELDDVVVQCAY